MNNFNCFILLENRDDQEREKNKEVFTSLNQSIVIFLII